MRLVVASANPHKVDEMRAILTDALGDVVELVARPPDVPDVDETGETLEANARLKAVALVEATGLPAVADDTGLEVDALGGAPGVRSARYSGEGAPSEGTRDQANVAKLLAELAARPGAPRTARFRTAIVLAWPDGTEVHVEGVVEGTIAHAPRGDGGFGYDPVFVAVDDEAGGRTFGELPGEVKHTISHRGRALRAMAVALRARLDSGRP